MMGPAGATGANRSNPNAARYFILPPMKQLVSDSRKVMGNRYRLRNHFVTIRQGNQPEARCKESPRIPSVSRRPQKCSAMLA